MIMRRLLCTFASIAASCFAGAVGCPTQPGTLHAIQARVLSRDGKPVNGLQPDNFAITEDGVPRGVSAAFHYHSPISAGILLDTSGSMTGKLWARR